mmetsp:Transcript_23765/g.67764  ORF Transcript_23765/g.67764 Transcript_23765/m.67764 type:complete len:214 (+) Transcript_23765:127-768(+)
MRLVDGRGRDRRQPVGHGSHGPQLDQQPLRALHDAVGQNGAGAEVAQHHPVQLLQQTRAEQPHAHGAPRKLRQAHDVVAPLLQRLCRPAPQAELADLRLQHGPHHADLAAVVHPAEHGTALLAQAAPARAARIVAHRAGATVWAAAAGRHVPAQRLAQLRMADAPEAGGVHARLVDCAGRGLRARRCHRIQRQGRHGVHLIYFAPGQQLCLEV